MPQKNNEIISITKSSNSPVKRVKYFFRDLSLKNKILVGVLSIIFLISIFGYLISIYVARNILIDTVASSNLRYADAIIEKIEISYATQVKNWIAISKIDVIKPQIIASNNEKENIENITEFAKQRDSEWKLFRNRNVEDAPDWIKEIYNQSFSITLRQVVENFEDAFGFESITEIIVTDRYGFNVMTSGWSSDYYQADEEWWTQAMEKDIYIGPIEKDNSTNSYSSIVATKIFDDNDRVIGVFRFDINVDDIILVIKESVISSPNVLIPGQNNVNVHLIDKELNIFYSSRGLKEVPEELKQIVFKRNKDFEIFGKEKGYKDEVLVLYTHSEAPNLTGNLNLTLIFEQPTTEIEKAARKLQLAFLVIIFITPFLLFLYIVAISRAVTTPVKALTLVASKIMEGNYDVKTGIESNDEFGLLAKTFEKMTQRLIALKQYNQTIIESVPDPVVTFDLEQNVVFYNSAMKKLFNENGHADITWGDLIKMCEKLANNGQDEAHSFEESVDIIFSTRKMISCGEIQIGTQHYERFMVPLVQSGNKLIGGLLMLHNITIQVEANQLKTNFLSLAAHQLRTPLGIIRWSIESILVDKKSKLSEDSRKSLRDVYESDLKLIELVRDLLNISKIEENIKSDIPKLTNVSDLLKSTLSSFDKEIANKHLKLETEIEDNIQDVKIDTHKLYEVIENLVSNAVRYSEENGIVIIKLAKELNYFKFTTKNWGIFIPENEQSKIFNKFFRATTAVSSEIYGSGLGLYLVKQYIDRWGGKITFTSSRTGGTEFIVKIPIEPKA